MTALLQIEALYWRLDKHARIRTEAWAAKLSEDCYNVDWKRNRNTYARLLLEMVKGGKFGEPFDLQPRPGPLPMLPAHLVRARVYRRCARPLDPHVPTAARRCPRCERQTGIPRLNGRRPS